MNSAHITELFDIIADGSLDAADIAAMSAEVNSAAQDPAAYLANDPSSAYTEAAGIPVWEWVLLEQLEGGLVFRGDTIAALYEQITEAFGEDELDLAVSELASLSEVDAAAKVAEELAPLYTRVNFSKPIGGAKLQVVLVRTTKLERFSELAAELGVVTA
jgi:hypothetical protein